MTNEVCAPFFPAMPARMNGPTVPSQIRRTRTNNLCEVGDLARPERRIAERPNPERDVDIVVDKIDVAICDQKFKSDTRVASQEFH